MDGDQDPAQGQPTRRIPAAVAARLDALHELAPLRGRRLLMAHAFLLASSSDAELEAAAAAHQAQADQLTDRRLVEACATPTGCWSRPGRPRSSSSATGPAWPPSST
jgi:hypothetical protein